MRRYLTGSFLIAHIAVRYSPLYYGLLVIFVWVIAHVIFYVDIIRVNYCVIYSINECCESLKQWTGVQLNIDQLYIL